MCPRRRISGREARKGNRQNLYFPEAMLEEIREQATRLGRSMSWVVQRAWRFARVKIEKNDPE